HDRDVLADRDLERDAAERVDLLHAHLVGAPQVVCADDGARVVPLLGPVGGDGGGGAHAFSFFGWSTLTFAWSFSVRRVLYEPITTSSDSFSPSVISIS